MTGIRRTLSTVSLLALTCACSFGTGSQQNMVAPPHDKTALTDQTLNPIAPSAGPLAELAESALAHGEAAAAISLARRALDVAPGDRVSAQVLAEALLVDGEADDSVAAFKALLAMDANDAAAHTGLGMALLATGDPAAAKPELMKAIAAKPGNAVLANAGLALALAGNPTEAVKALETSAMSEHSTARLRQNYALALTLAGERAKAYDVAALDVGAVPAVRQVDAWFADADKPLPQQLHQFAGLTIKPSNTMQTAALKAPAAIIVKTPTVKAVATAVEKPAMPATVVPIAVVAVTVAPPPLTAVSVIDHLKPTTIAVHTAAIIPVVATVSAQVTPAATDNKPISILPTALSMPAKPTVVVIKSARLGVPAVDAAAISAKLEHASFTPSVAAKSIRKPAGFASMASYTTTHVSKGWFVQLAAVAMDVSAPSLKARVSKQFGHWMAKFGLISTHDASHDGKNFKRIMLGPYANRTSAQSVCHTIQAKGKTCFLRAAAPAVDKSKI